MLTRNGWAVVAIGVVTLALGVVLDYREFVVVAAGLLVAQVVAIASLFLRPDLTSIRSISPARVNEGEPAVGTISIRNVGKRRTPPLVAQEAFGGNHLAIEIPGLRPGVQHQTTYMLPTARRGHYPVGPLTISFSDPFRLVRVAYARGSKSTLIVHPTVYRVSPLPTGRLREIDGTNTNSSQKGGIAFHSLREYVPGDDLRLIHWRSSAKTGTLLVRHNVVTNQPRLMIGIDTSAQSYESLDDFDNAVRVAASMVMAGVDARYPTEFFTTGGVTATIDLTGKGRTAALDLLAGLEMTEDDPGLNGLVGLVDWVKGAALGVVTGFPTAERARGVPRVRQRFEAITMVQVGANPRFQALSVAGATTLTCTDAEEFAIVWKRRFR